MTKPRMAERRSIRIRRIVDSRGPMTIQQIAAAIRGTEHDVCFSALYEIVSVLEEEGDIRMVYDQARPLSYVGTRVAYPGRGGVEVFEEWEP